MLIVDSIGVLNRLYGHADAAYVGGGFGRVLHNILEATAYGIPVIFGPDHASFPEIPLSMYSLRATIPFNPAVLPPPKPVYRLKSTR
jgi:3-deoxy-D-manno-octulosonic-acid transferase